jgi:pimeloyl-ACP methyl ester carboxylesterase
MARGVQARAGGWAWAAAGLAAGISGLAVTNRLISMSAGELYSVLGGEDGHYAWEHGDVFYSVRGRGAPLLLVHGIYVGASSFEYRRVFQRLSHEFRVYAIDLLGFGLSARPPVTYTPQLYIRLIVDFVRQVMGGVDQPVSVIASSLGAAFCIHAAASRTSLFERLVLIEPTGLGNLDISRPTTVGQLARGLLRSSVAGEGLYNLIASRASIRYYLANQAYANRSEVTDDLVDYYHLAAHQPGARFAPASFLSRTLDTPVGAIYPELGLPMLVAWGKDARMAPVEQARAFREANPRTEVRVFDCGALPQDEVPDEFVRDVASWLRLRSGSRRQR